MITNLMQNGTRDAGIKKFLDMHGIIITKTFKDQVILKKPALKDDGKPYTVFTHIAEVESNINCTT